MIKIEQAWLSSRIADLNAHEGVGTDRWKPNKAGRGRRRAGGRICTRLCARANVIWVSSVYRPGRGQPMRPPGACRAAMAAQPLPSGCLSSGCPASPSQRYDHPFDKLFWRKGCSQLCRPLPIMTVFEAPVTNELPDLIQSQSLHVLKSGTA